VTREASGRPRIYTTKRCRDCLATKTVLDRLGVVYEEIDIDEDDQSAATVLTINGGFRTVPTLVLADGRVLVEPSRQALFPSSVLLVSRSPRA
jgi:mycoredoxin